MKFNVFTLRDIKVWKKILFSFPKDNITFFHTPEYIATWKDYDDGQVICLHIEEGENHFLYSFLKMKIEGFSLKNTYYNISSVYGYGGMISNNCRCDSKMLDAINGRIDQWCQEENVVAEFIREFPFEDKETNYLRNLKKIHVRNNVLFKYNENKNAWSKEIKKKILGDVNRAINKGCRVEIDKDLNSLEGFKKNYKLLCQNKNWDEYYDFSNDYFQLVKNSLTEWSFIINIYYQKDLIASSLNFKFQGMIIHHLCSSNYKFRWLTPNDIMYHSILSYGAQMQCDTVFWGGGNSINPEDPQFRFKSKFSNRHSAVHIGTKVHNDQIYTDLCHQWEKKNPDKVEKYKNFFLKYKQ